jgi:peptide-methionine (S)-S-oxide reductase
MPRVLALFLVAACSAGASPSARDTSNDPAPIPPVGAHQEAAVFAGGCFWCMETDFDNMPGVVATTSGYAGGHTVNPTYDDVTTETTGHQESVRVVYDTTKITYEGVLDYYWHHIDPTDAGGSFCDRGDSYRSVVFTANDAQKTAAEASKAKIDASHVLPSPIVTPIEPLGTFYAAENYHQDYHLKNTSHYEGYRHGCGRDARVAALWGPK